MNATAPTAAIATGLAPRAARALAADPNAAATLDAAIREAIAPATRRAYRTAWAAWQCWADGAGVSALPAAPEGVAAYLGQRAADGAGMATLRMATAAIAAGHRASGHADPSKAPIVAAAMRGFARQAADRPARQARGLTSDALASIRGAINGAAARDALAARDMAIASVLSDAGLRRSEAAALDWADVAREADGTGRITIRRSKTDQAGDGAVVAITARAMADLDRMAELSGGARTGPVFRNRHGAAMSGRQIARRIAAVAAAAGLGVGYSGHSGRVGMAQRMTRAGAPAAAVMRQGRWGTTRMVARYTRSETAADAVRYLD